MILTDVSSEEATHMTSTRRRMTMPRAIRLRWVRELLCGFIRFMIKIQTICNLSTNSSDNEFFKWIETGFILQELGGTGIQIWKYSKNVNQWSICMVWNKIGHNLSYSISRILKFLFPPQLLSILAEKSPKYCFVLTLLPLASTVVFLPALFQAIHFGGPELSEHS